MRKVLTVIAVAALLMGACDIAQFIHHSYGLVAGGHYPPVEMVVKRLLVPA